MRPTRKDVGLLAILLIGAPRTYLQCVSCAQRVLYAYRTTGNPEILLVNQVLLGEALKKAPSMWPHLRDYNELVFGSSAGPPDRGKLLDKPYDDDNTGFIGNGVRVLGRKLPAAKVFLWLVVVLRLHSRMPFPG